MADTTEAIIESLESAFLLAKLEPRLNIRGHFSKIKGLKLTQQLEFLSPAGVTKKNFDILNDHFMDSYRSRGIRMTIVYPGVIDLFEFLATRQFITHIISAKSKINLELSLNHLGLFPNQYAGGISLHEKVSYLVSSKCSTYIGDMEIDVEISKSANCKSVIFQNSRDEIKDWKLQPDHYFNSPAEFLIWIRQEENLLSL